VSADNAIIEVAAALVFRARKLLISQRRAGDHLGGLWEFPGGKCRPGETLPACLRRELEEELGIEIQVGDWIDTLEWEYPEKTVRLHFYRCGLLRREPQAVECQAFAWIRADELAGYSFPPADAQIVTRLQQEPRLWAEE
jgi:mutator protein MutT